MSRKIDKTIGWLGVLTGSIVLAACGNRTQESVILDYEKTPAQTTPGTGDLSVGAAEQHEGEAIAFDAEAYLTPVNGPISTPELTDAFYANLPTSCGQLEQGQEASEQAGDKIAVMIGGECSELSRAEAEVHFQKLAEAMARLGVDITAEIAEASDSSDELSGDMADSELVAEPSEDLGALVMSQLDVSESPFGGDTAFALLDGDQWGGSYGPRTFGSNNFGATAQAHAYVKWNDGIGVDGQAQLTGRVFGYSRSLLSATLDGSALNGDRAGLRANVTAGGYTVFNREVQEPEYAASGSLASFSKRLSGDLRFSIGPVPFNVRWIISANGDAPWAVTARPTHVNGSFEPNLTSTASLEGGPSIVVASAGVGGSLTIINTTLDNEFDVVLRQEDDTLNFCYTAGTVLRVDSALGGNLYGFAEVGWPDRYVFGRSLGWRGSMNFVDWQGFSQNFPVVGTDTESCQDVVGAIATVASNE